MSDTTQPSRTTHPAGAIRPRQPPRRSRRPSLDRELADIKDRLLRTLAEMENSQAHRARGRRRADLWHLGVRPRRAHVADNMHRALEALDDELREKADSSVKVLLDGVEITERELMNVLEKHGVKRIEPIGQKFDPNRHQAMYEAEDASVPAGHVAQVIQAGYLIGERVLRPALVAVSKGGAKVARADERQFLTIWRV